MGKFLEPGYFIAFDSGLASLHNGNWIFELNLYFIYIYDSDQFWNLIIIEKNSLQIYILPLLNFQLNAYVFLSCIICFKSILKCLTSCFSNNVE